MKKNEKIHGKYFIAVLLFFLMSILASCSQEKQTTTSLDSYATSDQHSAQTTQNTVQDIDGVQTVTLSWGKFNYNPETITVNANEPVKIIADLDRLQGCFQSLVVQDLGIEVYFDENNPSYTFTPAKTGTFAFSCAMGMGKGTLIVT